MCSSRSLAAIALLALMVIASENAASPNVIASSGNTEQEPPSQSTPSSQAAPGSAPAPQGSTILLPEQAFAGGVLTGVVIGPDDQPVPNTPVRIAGGAVSGNLSGEVIGDRPDDSTKQPSALATCADNLKNAVSSANGADASGVGGSPTGKNALSSRAANLVRTDALGRFALCVLPDVQKITVALPSSFPDAGSRLLGSPVETKVVQNAADVPLPQPPIPYPPEFVQPDQKVSMPGNFPKGSFAQNGKQGSLPVATAISSDGKKSISTFKAPHSLQPGPVQWTFTDADGKQSSFNGGIFKTLRAFLDRSKLRSNEGADFEYEVQTGPEAVSNGLCVEMKLAGPIVMVQGPPPQVPLDSSGRGKFGGKIRATQVAPGSTVPFDIATNFHSCTATRTAITGQPAIPPAKVEDRFGPAVSRHPSAPASPANKLHNHLGQLGCTNLDLGPDATVINFDSLSTSESLTEQFASQGVHFNGTAEAGRPPVVAHSAPFAAHSLYDDFGSTNKPIRITFNSPQAAVGMYVGREASTDPIPLFASLAGFSADESTQIASDEVMLPPSATAISRCLVVRAPPGQSIRSVLLDYSDESGNSAYERRWMDDLTFHRSTTSAPDLPPVVTIVQPAYGAVLGSGTPSVLQAEIHEDIGLRSVSMSINDGPPQILPFAPDPGDPTLYHVEWSLTGLRPDYSSTLRVRAIDTAGQLGQADTSFIWRPPVSGDIWITGIEAIQSIQNSAGTISLLGFKRTVVRVFVQAREDIRGPWNNVTARLMVHTPDGIAHWLSPMNPGGTLTVPTAGSRRNSLADSFYFMLDPEETAPGNRDVEAELTSLTVRPETNTTNNHITKTLHFGPPEYLSIYGAVWANQSDPAGPAAPWSDFELHRQYVENVFPVSHMSIVPLPGIGTSPQTFSSLSAARDWGTRTLSRMPDQRLNLLDNWDTCKCGYADDRRSEEQNNRWTAGEVMAQEIAHTMGLWWHTFSDGTPYPPRTGLIGPVLGMKTVLTDLPPYGVGVVLINGDAPFARSHDIMSYDDPDWISAFTYCTLMRVIPGSANRCPDGMEGATLSPQTEVQFAMDQSNSRSDHTLVASLQFPAGSPIAARLAFEKPLTFTGNDAFLLVLGTIRPNGTAEFSPFEVIHSAKNLSTRTQGDAYTLIIEDAGGRSLANTRFSPNSFHLHAGEPIPFDLIVPYPQGAVKIVLRQGDRVLAERSVSAHAPQITSGQFDGARDLRGTHKLDWQASDADGDPLIFTLEYSADNGQSWLPLRVGIRDSFAVIDFDTLPGSENGRFRIFASDGVNTTEAQWPNTFRVPRKPPQLAPLITQELGNGNVLLLGNAFDTEDGAITAQAAYLWTSDKDGKLGSGPWITTQKLSPGPHVITLTVKDSDGNPATQSVQVTVPPRPAGKPGGAQGAAKVKSARARETPSPMSGVSGNEPLADPLAANQRE